MIGILFLDFFRKSSASIKDTHISIDAQSIINPDQNINILYLPSIFASSFERNENVQTSISHTNINNENCVPQDETQSNTLKLVSPLPTIHQNISKRKQNVTVLT